MRRLVELGALTALQVSRNFGQTGRCDGGDWAAETRESTSVEVALMRP